MAGFVSGEHAALVTPGVRCGMWMCGAVVAVRVGCGDRLDRRVASEQHSTVDVGGRLQQRSRELWQRRLWAVGAWSTGVSACVDCVCACVDCACVRVGSLTVGNAVHGDSLPF